VLAEIVEINVEIHNLFQQLYDDEQARLHLYLEEAKKKALTDEQMRHLAQMQPIYRIMGRAVQIEHLIDDIKQALATQQVLDQTVMEKVEQDGAQVQDFTDLLVDTLQTSRKVSDQLHHSLTRLQRLEKLSIVVSVLERQVFENVALKHERSLDELLRSIVEDALIRVAAALEEGQIDDLFPAQTATAELALSELIAKGFLAVD
jgi:vacuolar-type H+-ATPase subunit I/STV1